MGFGTVDDVKKLVTEPGCHVDEAPGQIKRDNQSPDLELRGSNGNRLRLISRKDGKYDLEEVELWIATVRLRVRKTQQKASVRKSSGRANDGIGA